ncbi:hypothetical protein ACO0SA_001029 [Hanseniaspora valbyensis]
MHPQVNREMIRYTPVFATSTASGISSNNTNSANNNPNMSQNHYQLLQQMYNNGDNIINKSTSMAMNYNNYGYSDILFQQQQQQNIQNNNMQKVDNSVEYYNYYDNTGYQYEMPQQFNNNNINTSNNNNNNNINNNSYFNSNIVAPVNKERKFEHTNPINFSSMVDTVVKPRSQPHSNNQNFNHSSKIQPHTTAATNTNNNSHIIQTHNHNPYLNNNSSGSNASFHNKYTNSSNSKNFLNRIDHTKKAGSNSNGNNNRYDTYSSFKRLSKKCFESLKNNNTTTRHISAMDINNMVQFIEMYKNMSEATGFNPLKQQDIVYLLRIILELHRNVRFNLLKLKRKPDYDDQSIYKNLINLLFQLLEMVNNDLIAGNVFENVKIDQSIIGTLINCYKDFEMIENALKVWKLGVFKINTSTNGENNKTTTNEFKDEIFDPRNVETQRVFLNPGVIGSILPILQDIGHLSLDKISIIYAESKKLALMNTNSKGLDTLNLGMIQVHLDNNMVDEALLLYHENLKICSQDYNTNNYWKISISEIQFISKCKKIDIAMRFFEKLIDQKYQKTGGNNSNGNKNNLQASHVNLFMINIWEIGHDLEKVVYVWNKVLNYYGSKVYPGVISSLNDTFFKIFFEYYSSTSSNELRLQGFLRLIELINQNAVNIKNNKLENNEVFFNILLTHSSKNWKDFNVYKYLIKCYQTYCNFQLITIVPYRISLKSLGYITNTPVKVIRNTWIQLINKLKKNGKLQYISNPDFAALRDATLGWCKNECIPELVKLNNRIDILKKQQAAKIQYTPDCRSNTLIQLDMEKSYNPAIEALQSSGAFDIDLFNSKLDDLTDGASDIDQQENMIESLSNITLTGLLSSKGISSAGSSYLSSGETSDFDCETPMTFLNTKYNTPEYMNSSPRGSSSHSSVSTSNHVIGGGYIEGNSISSVDINDPITLDIQNLQKKITSLTEEKNNRIELYWQLYNEYKQYCRDAKQQYDYLVLNVLKNFNSLEPELSEIYNENLSA